MAGKNMLPLLAVAGVAAVALTKKKKKKKAATEGNGRLGPNGGENGEAFPSWTEVGGGSIPGGIETGPDGADKLVFDEACQAFADKLNMDAHNTYITGMFHTAIKQGVTSAEEIVQAMLVDQAPQCPWADPASYTPLMKGVYDQLLSAVREYGRLAGSELS